MQTCGCAWEYVPGASGEETEIVFCPLHSKAKEMLVILRNTSAYLGNHIAEEQNGVASIVKQIDDLIMQIIRDSK